MEGTGALAAPWPGKEGSAFEKRGRALEGPGCTRVSPGTTGLRNLQLSIPPKKKFLEGESGSIIQIPPTCAMASICSTPGAILQTLVTSTAIHHSSNPPPSLLRQATGSLLMMRGPKHTQTLSNAVGADKRMMLAKPFPHKRAQPQNW